MDRRHHGLQNVEGKELLEEQPLPAIGRVGLLEFFVLRDTQRDQRSEWPKQEHWNLRRSDQVGLTRLEDLLDEV